MNWLIGLGVTAAMVGLAWWLAKYWPDPIDDDEDDDDDDDDIHPFGEMDPALLCSLAALSAM